MYICNLKQKEYEEKPQKMSKIWQMKIITSEIYENFSKQKIENLNKLILVIFF